MEKSLLEMKLGKWKGKGGDEEGNKLTFRNQRRVHRLYLLGAGGRGRRGLWLGTLSGPEEFLEEFISFLCLMLAFALKGGWLLC
jgi:hypothetical protein